jgi:zinc transporter 1/2/3
VISLFSLATPVGIGIGFLFDRLGPGKLAASMSALASGTFLYVAMMEVIPKELESSDHRGLKMVALLAGFGAMSLLAVWA